MNLPANIYIYKELERRIIEMEYQPGDPLSEKQLIEEFNVSRTPIREAILKLSEKGLLDLKPRVGTFVTQIDLPSVKYAYEVKKNLEGLAAELAASRRTEEEVTELLKLLNVLKAMILLKTIRLALKTTNVFIALFVKLQEIPC